MRRRTFLLLLLPPLSVACLTNYLPAQRSPEQSPDLFTRVERAFSEQEPDWKLEESRASETTDPTGRDILLRSGETQAAVSVKVWRREQDSREVFAAESLAFDNTRGKRMVKGSVQGLGDENHLWTNAGTDAWPMLTFRKGRVNVLVFAPSTDVAKRFARRVLEQIEAS